MLPGCDMFSTSFQIRLSTASSEQTSLMKTEETKAGKEWLAKKNDYNWVMSGNQMTDWLVREEIQKTSLRNAWDERDEEVESLREEITWCLNEFELMQVQRGHGRKHEADRDNERKGDRESTAETREIQRVALESP